MSHFGNSVEYGLHTLVWLAGRPADQPSSRDLADLQELPPAFLAKILSKLEKAGIVASSGGIHGGYRLAREPETISMLEVIDAIEGEKRLFDCKNVRERCVLWQGRSPPPMSAVCGIHAVMIRAERIMRGELGKTSVADLARGAHAGATPELVQRTQSWLSERIAARGEARMTGIRAAAKARRHQTAAEE